jgi:hypothetical protein
VKQEISQLAFTNGNLLGNKSTGTRLVIDLGVDGHIQGMHWENALTVMTLALSRSLSAPDLLDLKCHIDFLVTGNQPQLGG